MKNAADVVGKAGLPVYTFPSTDAAKTALADILQPGDHILLKGSRSMALEKLLDTFPTIQPAPLAPTLS
jgi:UDP-N-acetylmuramyl pentapeptide synthase